MVPSVQDVVEWDPPPVSVMSFNWARASAAQVCAILAGGGYAEKVAAPAGQLLPIPPGVTLKDAASLPEVACTVWSTVFMTSRLSRGETLLVHGGSSGIGTFVIQIAKYQGARVFITAEETDGKGVDVILDSIGAPYFQRNLESLNFDGRIFSIGTAEGDITQLDFRSLFAKRLTVQAPGLRNQSPENKAVIVSEVEKIVWPAVATGKVKPVILKYLLLSMAAEAHKLMESSKHIGKILLIP
ncbi:unnamed protein product [Citrullus colocynthis]|uniref:Enoyl reductase (ER) domain-containing protein n=1 Tax=Citrullus colocynthis TaxID=252529 RepID=A0ABP0YN95_9ROSI